MSQEQRLLDDWMTAIPRNCMKIGRLLSCLKWDRPVDVAKSGITRKTTGFS